MSESKGDKAAAAEQPLAAEDLTPSRIVRELDRHIVGQRAAKRAVALALRSRWRRMQVESPCARKSPPKIF